MAIDRITTDAIFKIDTEFKAGQQLRREPAIGQDIDLNAINEGLAVDAAIAIALHTLASAPVSATHALAP
ncbi:hypothetical protein [Bradyrhizobium sp.]|uniref:hypothetical protein n=1 Tax=Bradyrhizobium sp. TaxID=376 RepID=UPI001DF738F2|nr:hypothetical protein [Bradyrhizobium sp.]MBI5320777.1 hypothetical protein [Bradyrhizobium sp.]